MTEANHPAYILCPHCYRKLIYVFQKCWYICPVHGPMLLDEDLFHYYLEALT